LARERERFFRSFLDVAVGGIAIAAAACLPLKRKLFAERDERKMVKIKVNATTKTTANLPLYGDQRRLLRLLIELDSRLFGKSSYKKSRCLRNCTRFFRA